MRRFVVLVVAGAVFFSLTGCGNKTTKAIKDLSSLANSKPDPEFQKALDATKKAEYKVVYKGSGGDFQNLTLAQDPPSKSVLISDDSSYYQNGKKVTTCTSLNDQPTCVESDSASTGSLVSSYGAGFFGGSWIALLGGTSFPGVKREADQTIAGQKALCISFRPDRLASINKKQDSSEQTTCIDKKTGVLLKSKTDDGKGKVTTLTATSYSSHTTDADFTAPAAAQNLDDLSTIPTTIATSGTRATLPPETEAPTTTIYTNTTQTPDTSDY